MSEYSLDLRQKVIEFIDSGNSQRHASKIFKISKTTINRWCLRYKNEGHYKSRKRLGSKAKIDKESFALYIQNNPNATSDSIGKAFGMSASGARYWLRAIGFSYKKKPLPTWKLIKKSEKNI